MRQVTDKEEKKVLPTNGHKGKDQGENKELALAGDETEAEGENSETQAEASEESAQQAAPAENKPKSRRKMPLYIVGAILLVGAVGGLMYWLYARNYESTDDAFVESDVVQVNPKVSAYVAKVHARENQFVHKGDLLVELDTRDLEARLQQAHAQLATARAQRNAAQASVDLTRHTTQASVTQASSNVESAQQNVEQTRASAEAKKDAITQARAQVRTAEANLEQTRAQIPAAEANLRLAQIDVNRYQNLVDRGDIPRQQLDRAQTTLRNAQSQLEAIRKQIDAAQSRVSEMRTNVAAAEDNYRQALAQVAVTRSQVGESAGRLEAANAAPQQVAVSQSQVGTTEAQIAQAEAAVHQAELELSYTKIYAPEDGYVARKTVQEGQLVQPGQALMAISQTDVWVVANFKETQLGSLHPGQEVDIKVDAYPDVEFHGKVDSFQAGTGSRFSVFPAENATGNYVKVVQRVPVKIVFDQQPDKSHPLAPGMSVEPTVRIR